MKTSLYRMGCSIRFLRSFLTAKKTVVTISWMPICQAINQNSLTLCKIQNSLTNFKFPDFSLTLRKNMFSLTFPWSVWTLYIPPRDSTLQNSWHGHTTWHTAHHKHTNFNQVEATLEESLGELTYYYRANSLCAKPDKSQVTAFHQWNKEAKRPRKIKCNNSDLDNTAYHKYLGVTQDRTHSYKENIQNTKMKVAKRNNRMKKLENSKWGTDVSTIRTTALALCLILYSTTRIRQSQDQIYNKWQMRHGNRHHKVLST